MQAVDIERILGQKYKIIQDKKNRDTIVSVTDYNPESKCNKCQTWKDKKSFPCVGIMTCKECLSE